MANRSEVAGVSLWTEQTLAALRRHKDQLSTEKREWAEAYQANGLVFCWEDGRPIYPDTITEWLARLAEECALPHLTLHGLRHTRRGGGTGDQ